MIRVEKIVPVARERLVTVRDDAPLVEAAKFLDGKHINLVVVCDKGGAMVGIVKVRSTISTYLAALTKREWCGFCGGIQKARIGRRQPTRRRRARAACFARQGKTFFR